MFAAGALGSRGPQLSTKKALLLVDLQNDFVHPEGKLFVPNTTEFVPKLPHLIKQFRSKGDVISITTAYTEPRGIYSDATGGYGLILKSNLTSRVPSVFAEDLNDGNEQPTATPPAEASHIIQGGILNKDVEAFLTPPYNSQASWSQCCVPLSNGALMPSILSSVIDTTVDTEVVKSNYSPFQGSSFLLNLRMQLVTELYVCGSLSNISVYATVLDAVSHGMSVTIIEDCVGYRDERCHREAMRQMADNLGANGIDCQELLDDLAGLLGDVVHEEDFKTHHHVAFQLGLQSKHKPDPKQKASAWLSSLEESTPEVQETGPSSQGLPPNSTSTAADALKSQRQHTEPLSVLGRQRPPESPPRKRHFDDQEPEARDSKVHTRRRASHEGHTGEGLVVKSTRSRRRRPQAQDRRRSPTPLHDLWPQMESKSTGDIPRTNTNDSTMAVSTPQVEMRKEPIFNDTPALSTTTSALSEQKSPKQVTEPTNPPPVPTPCRGPLIATDSYLSHSILPQDLSATIFTTLHSEVAFQPMHHRSGAVPRLVAAQGLCTSTAIPIYRHPADATPPLLPFTPTVELIRRYAEEAVGHELNHVLIQLYRGPLDAISEHADKTLDIVPRTMIVNYSAGAMRTMVLRRKISAMSTLDVDVEQQQQGAGTTGGVAGGGLLADPQAHMSPGPPRQAIRVPLPHNSLFVMGPKTNRAFLHGIRADGRMRSEKSAEELTQGAQRISLTFRRVGTWVSEDGEWIWGLGAKGKRREEAGRVSTGDGAEYERMIRAFGEENRSGVSWDWGMWYGEGFDVVDGVGVGGEEGGVVEGKREGEGG
jgi:nicotinamidase-related amidase/alkylated DNA repair dioxygenase AlkB